ncbi:MAG: hypothetical protein KDK48_00940 [Chlamydiia bacterium]|nr:hypothetical protein [Chlamydiia bacterium]
MNAENPAYEPEGEEYEMYTLSEEMDREILLHRDAHFGGKFDVMLEYYENEGRGVDPDFELERIRQLAQYEEETGENLAALLLTGADAERVFAARQAYKTLREICEVADPKQRYPRLIAELILSEDEEGEAAVETVVSEGKTIVPFLLDLLRSEEFHDPLFPGYGRAPYLAAKCLGLLGEQRALFSLFQEVGADSFQDEHLIVRAIGAMGENALEFLLPILKSKPYGFENERAALCLTEFSEDGRVHDAALQLLEDPEVYAHPTLASFLILSLESLSDPKKREKVRALLEKAPLNRDLKLDATALFKCWK